MFGVPPFMETPIFVDICTKLATFWVPNFDTYLYFAVFLLLFDDCFGEFQAARIGKGKIVFQRCQRKLIGQMKPVLKGCMRRIRLREPWGPHCIDH